MMYQFISEIFKFTTEDLMTALSVFWQGCLAIAGVILAVALLTFFLNYIFVKIEDNKASKKAAEGENTEAAEDAE